MRIGKKFALGFLPTLLVLMALLVSACGGSTATTAKTEQHLRLNLGTEDIASFDPAVATDSASIDAINMAFTGLVQLDDNLQVKDQLAASHSVSEDGLTWTFILKPNLVFSDGTPLTSEDVVFSIDRALDPEVVKLNGVTLTYLGLIKGAADRSEGKVKTLIGTSLIAKDPTTVEIKVDHKTAYFLATLTYPTAFVVEKKLVEQYGNLDWTKHLSDNGGQGGNGPFVVQKWDSNVGITFVPNAKYYGPKPKLEKVSYLIYKDAESAYKGYQAGQLDQAGIPPAELAAAQQLTSEFHKDKQLAIDYIAMNYLYEPLDNINIRKGLALALNRDVILQAVYKGSRIPTCHIVPEGLLGFSPNLTCTEGTDTKGDTAKAKTLFEQGMKEKGITVAAFSKIKFTYATGSAAADNLITTILQTWKNVLGVDIKSDPVDFNTRLKLVDETLCTKPNVADCKNKGLSIWFAAWISDYSDPQDWLSLFFEKGQSNNAHNYGQNLSTVAAAQKAIQDELMAADVDLTDGRIAHYNDIEQKIINDIGWLPIDQRTAQYLQKAFVKGTTPNAQGLTPPDDWGNIFIADH